MFQSRHIPYMSQDLIKTFFLIIFFNFTGKEFSQNKVYCLPQKFCRHLLYLRISFCSAAGEKWNTANTQAHKQSLLVYIPLPAVRKFCCSLWLYSFQWSAKYKMYTYLETEYWPISLWWYFHIRTSRKRCHLYSNIWIPK